MSSVIGCGVDIEELTRFDKFVSCQDNSVMRDICTTLESEDVHGCKRLKLALRFSCKEAFFKALGVSWTNSNIFWQDIELLFYGQGVEKYKVALSGHAKRILKKSQATIKEAYFDYNEHFVRFCVVLTKGSCNEVDFIKND
jgi:phosphopantetheine--protein transferase-like protein